MAAQGVPTNPSSHNIATILPKLSDQDPDIRYMTLNDLHKMLLVGGPNFLSHDYTTCAKLVEGLLHTLNDSNGDVQNMSVQTLGAFVKKAPESILCPTIEKVSQVKTGNSVDTTLAATAVRQIVTSLAQPVAGVPRSGKVLEAYNAISKALIPRLVGKVVVPVPNAKGLPSPPRGMLEDDLASGHDSNAIDLLTDVARCFGPMLQEVELQALEQICMRILEAEKCGMVMKKKAVTAIAALSPYFTDGLLAHHVSYSIEQLRQPHITSQQRKLYLQVYGSLAKTIPQKFGPYLKTLTPFVLAPLSQEELEQQRESEAENEGERDVQLEEAREAALVAIENFLQACAQDMKAYIKDVADSSTRFLKYEPNVADDEDEEMEEEDEDEEEFEADEDFEEETGFDDEDDVSWKVRRCSAKTLHALIDTLDPNDPVVYGQIAPALIVRFKEKEESVRNEVIATLAFLIAKTGFSAAGHADNHHSTAQPSRKRRRGFSESLGSDHSAHHHTNGYASPSTPPPTDKATQGLAKMNPEVVKAVAKLLKSNTVPTTSKQALVSLIKDMVIAQKGGLADRTDQVLDPVIDVLSTLGSNPASNSLRVEIMHQLRVIAEYHSSSVIQPAKVVPALAKASKDRYAKVSAEALATIEAYIKALTPPRATKAQSGQYLSQLYQVAVERVGATDTDTEVRQKAVQALGLLIGRTSGSTGANLLSQNDRFAGQQIIAERLRNELTRLACVRAVDTIAVLAQSPQDFKPGWVDAVALELGAQLNKASRSLRGASLAALKMLAVNQASRESLSDSTISQLVSMLVSLLRPDDLHMMGPALIVLAAFAKDRPTLVATGDVISGICAIVVSSSITGVALDALVTCVDAIGQAGAGQNLMQALLNVGTQGDPDITGQVIGTLLVAGGEGKMGVRLADFTRELSVQQDETKKCLALSVLGEAALRLGTSCPLKPTSFTPYFADNSDKVKLSAAVALGRAGAGDVKTYLPSIMEALNSNERQYLLLHSVKELLQHSNAEEDIKPYMEVLWQNIVNSGQAEDNKVVGAECIGRLAIIDPAAYLPQLQTFLQNSNPADRGMVISALRYVFSETEGGYDDNLRTTIIPMLATMLADNNLDNQRMSLTTFNSALHNKPDLVLPHLQDLLPYAMRATVIRPELVREVKMGPFTLKVDDGKDMRHSAYETLYALLDTPASRQRLDIPAFYDRIVAGLGDEHEIKILCCLVLSKLLVIAPAETMRRLDDLAAALRAVLAEKLKENAVKQDVEKLNERQKAVIKVSVVLNKGAAAGVEESRGWRDYFEWVRKEMAPLLKTAEEEMRGAAEF
ncbi:hypothetical protein LTR78_000439 [Recurvomyces mirabilis]|uniref:TATA-binding protein interacting (TIP20) domain-containing protein n=1 Tax=Recurvomyces mirabilis TaxID=574656 RepID=A0AAE0WXR5_9PEZI|nr:hypothetical protein LTR78_000439 [Recurvomyces mirabilis]KAK5162094.1 hypothetical protein LTS14_000440 [Recurvomyces mirabilis]